MEQKATIPVLEKIAFSILFIWYAYLCFHFYAERSTMTDYAFQLFKMIETKNFNVEHLRYASITTQWLVVPLIKLGASLKTILIAYSFNVFLQYFIAFCIIRFYFKNQLFAWCIIAYIMATVHFGFFYTGCELVFGGVWICTLLAITERLENNEQNSRLLYLFLVINLILLVTTHAFLLIITGIILGSFCVFRFSKIKCGIIIALGILFLIKLKFLTDGYESGKFNGVSKDIFLPATINKSWFTFFFKQQYNTTFIAVKISSIILIVFFLIKRRWVFVGITVLALFALFLMIYSFMPNGESVVYMDSYQSMIYLVGWILFSIGFYLYFRQYSKYFVAVIFTASLVGLFKLYNEHQFTDRIAYYYELMDKAAAKGCSKLVMQENEVDMQKVALTWATPYETLLLSSLKGKSQTIYINNNPEFDLNKYNNPNKFLGATWLLDDTTNINNAYFKLEAKPYRTTKDLNF
ncbi:MAG: hypothetical protein U0U67_05730 [Chitinophagales bacterium]